MAKAPLTTLYSARVGESGEIVVDRHRGAVRPKTFLIEPDPTTPFNRRTAVRRDHRCRFAETKVGALDALREDLRERWKQARAVRDDWTRRTDDLFHSLTAASTAAANARREADEAEIAEAASS